MIDAKGATREQSTLAPSRPAVSVGLAVYNGAKYLELALATLHAQRFDDFELIISDNGSTDETPQICTSHAARDSRLRYHRSSENRGASWNFNRVLELARADMFVWAAHDDEWDPTFLGRCVGVLRERQGAVACYSRYQLVDEHGAARGEPLGVGCEGVSRRDRWNQVLRNWDVHPAVYGVMRTTAMRRTRGVRACLSSDLIFMSELLLHGDLIVVPDVLHRKRLPPGNLYRSSHETLLSLSGHRKRPGLFHRYAVLREELAGLRHAGLRPEEERALARDAWRHYFTSRSWLYDGIATAKRLVHKTRAKK